MKYLKSKMLLIVLTVLIITSLPSCMTTKTQVGAFRETQGKEYVYDRGKQMWVFWGLVPIGRTNVNTPVNGNCEVVTKFRLTDVLISGVTFGILTSYSIKVKAKKTEQTEK